jgi:hypothetical protein
VFGACLVGAAATYSALVRGGLALAVGRKARKVRLFENLTDSELMSEIEAEQKLLADFPADRYPGTHARARCRAQLLCDEQSLRKSADAVRGAR